MYNNKISKCVIVKETNKGNFISAMYKCKPIEVVSRVFKVINNVTYSKGLQKFQVIHMNSCKPTTSK